MGRKGKDGWSGLGARIVRYVWSGSVLRRGWTGIVDTGGVDHKRFDDRGARSNNNTTPGEEMAYEVTGALREQQHRLTCRAKLRPAGRGVW